jgi:uncharacterized protein
MIIEAGKVPPEGGRYAGEEPSAVLEIEGEADLRAGGALRYDLSARVVSGELIVTGRLDLDMAFRCSRCAEFFALHVQEPRFEFVHALKDRWESVELTPDMREAILLAFPSYALCSARCRGLCPQCGANRNRGACDCAPPRDRRWSVLEKLDIK